MKDGLKASRREAYLDMEHIGKCKLETQTAELNFWVDHPEGWSEHLWIGRSLR